MHSLNDMRNLTKKIAVNFMSCLANVTFFHFNDREILLKIFFYFFFAGFFIVLLLLVLYLIIGELLLAYFVLFCLLTGCEDE